MLPCTMARAAKSWHVRILESSASLVPHSNALPADFVGVAPDNFYAPHGIHDGSYNKY